MAPEMREKSTEAAAGASYRFDESSPLSSSLGYQIRRTHLLLETFMQQKLAEHDLQIGMWYFLRVLWMEDGLTQRELSRRLGMAEPTILEQLRNMEKRNLVRREQGQEDRRKRLVYLTKSGRDLRKKLLPYIDELSEAALAGFSESEITAFTSMLSRTRDNLRKAIAAIMAERQPPARA